MDQFNNLCKGRFHTKKKNDGQKLVWEVYYSSYNDIIIVLSQLLPYLKSKKEVSELMIQYCKSRLNRPSHKSTFSTNEIELFDQIKLLIKRGE